jgi:hypothetical protein
MFKVYSQRCNECLFGKNKIVSNERRKDLLRDIAAKGTHFVCHKATIRGESVCCKGFYDSHSSGLIRVAQRLGVIELVPLPDAPSQGQGATMHIEVPDNWAVPEGFEEISDLDVNERIQKDDLIWDGDGWAPASRHEIGGYCSHNRTARALPKPTSKRIMRRRAAK